MISETNLFRTFFIVFNIINSMNCRLNTYNSPKVLEDLYCMKWKCEVL